MDKSEIALQLTLACVDKIDISIKYSNNSAQPKTFEEQVDYIKNTVINLYQGILHDLG